MTERSDFLFEFLTKNSIPYVIAAKQPEIIIVCCAIMLSDIMNEIEADSSCVRLYGVTLQMFGYNYLIRQSNAASNAVLCSIKQSNAV